MEVSVSEAKVKLTDLVRRAEAGDEVILTRHGKPVIRLSPVSPQRSPEERRAVMEAVLRSARAAPSPGPGAARSQDFLYDKDGLPA